MRRHTHVIMGSCLVSLAAMACPAALAASRGCDSLLQERIANVEVTSASETTGTLPAAELVPERGARGQPVSPYLRNMPSFCRVKATLTPVPKSRIGIELWLPEQWNGKLLGIGNHGFGGNFEYGDMAMGLQRGYAVVTTDAGHSATKEQGRSDFNIGSAKFAAGNDVAVDDFAWRAFHEMTVAAKKLLLLKYGAPQRKAYFFGCSNGGRHAMREVQQFPADYDGVIAGSAAQYWTRFNAGNLMQFQASVLPSGAKLSEAKLALATKSAVAACDRLDGVADGIAANQEHCRWDPHTIECKAGDNPGTCLTGEEAAAIKRIEDPITDPTTGEMLYAGMTPGSEVFWWRNVAALNRVTANYFHYMVLDPSWSDADAAKANVVDLIRKSEMPGAPGARINSINPDLSAFREHGGKLIQYHGWNDPAMAPGFYTRYYTQVIDLQPGPDAEARTAGTQSFYRLFMAPGMAHCYGGAGPVDFGGLDHRPLPTIDADHDMLAALDRWVEKGIAPDRVIATEFDNAKNPKRQMPICAYPTIAAYVSGDVNRADSFVCKAPAK